MSHPHLHLQAVMAFGLIVGPILGGHLAKYDVKVGLYFLQNARSNRFSASADARFRLARVVNDLPHVHI